MSHAKHLTYVFLLLTSLLGIMVYGLFSATPALATIEEDQTPLSADELSSALSNNPDATDTAPTMTAQSASSDTTTTDSRIGSSVSVTSYAGATMFETAVAEATAAYPNGSSSAIIVGPGDAWIDALSATGLAASKGPILFTYQDHLNDATLAELKDLGVKSVIITGGTAAVSDDVVTELGRNGITVEARLGGANAIGTQEAIFSYGLDNSCWSTDKVIFATSTGFGDALSVSPIAYADKAPIFLVDSSGQLNQEQKNLLIAAAKQGYCKKPIAVGGSAVIDNSTVGFGDYISALAGGSGNTEWLWGATQYETSSTIAQWAVNNDGFSWNKMAFATGNSPYDALAGSVLQGASKSALLLIADYSSSTVSFAGEHGSGVSAVRFFGGTGAVSMRERMGVADALNFPYAAIPGFKVYVDAGHGQNNTNNGGYDSGACANGYEEATLNKDLADRVASILQNEYGVSVFLNDDGGWYKLRHQEAIDQGCNALLSIHFNDNERGGSGSMSLIHDQNPSFLSEAWQSQIHPYLISAMGLYDYGKRTQDVAILSGYLPATLLEICFINNQSDMDQYFAREDYVAHMIAKGIVS